MASASTVLPRILEPETLDHLAPDDPVARRSRRDLRRVNAFMGARRILARALDRVTREPRREPLRIVELGCGDGRLMLEVARHRGERWPGATIDLLDRQPIVDAPTIAAYAAAGWHARPVVADVLDWADARRRRALGRRRRQPVPASLRGRRARPRPRRLRPPRRCPGRMRAAAQPLRPRRQPPDLLSRRQRGDAQRRRAQRSRRLRRRRARRCLAGRRERMAPRRIRRRPVHPLLLRRAPRGRRMTMSFDAAIVGAGPAGSATAILLARAGWSVALIERQAFPRRKVCGECVAASNFALLDALGVGAEFERRAGAELRRVALLRGGDSGRRRVAWRRSRGPALGSRARPRTARHACSPTPPRPPVRPACSRARCRRSTAPGAFRSAAAAVASGASSRSPRAWSSLRTARGNRLPAERDEQREARAASDLFAFKANFRDAAIAADLLPVLSFAGGYGGMVVADDDLATLACCVRADRLQALRGAQSGASAGAVVEAMLRRECAGVRDCARRSRARRTVDRERAAQARHPSRPGRRHLSRRQRRRRGASDRRRGHQHGAAVGVRAR